MTGASTGIEKAVDKAEAGAARGAGAKGRAGDKGNEAMARPPPPGPSKPKEDPKAFLTAAL